MTAPLKTVGIISSSGHTGGELIRLLSKHPDVKLSAVSSESKEKENILEAHSFLQKSFSGKFVSGNVKNFIDCDLVFIAASAENQTFGIVNELLEAGVKIVDMTSTFRVPTKDGKASKDKNLVSAIYGIPEINRKNIKKAKLVANPGCMATACILCAYPLTSAGLVERVILDCKIGLSAAGSQPSPRTHYPTAFQSVYGYEKHPHRHYPEILANLKVKTHFFPQLVPISRGILCSAYCIVKQKTSITELVDSYNIYSKDFFIRTTKSPPSTALVKGSNFCDIGGFFLEDDLFAASSALDNLGKGGAGQAIQNMNLMLGFEESSGLKDAPIYP